MKFNIKKLLTRLAKGVLFLLLFLMVFNYTDTVLRNKEATETLHLVSWRPDNYYDVILAGSSHMEYSIQPAQLFGEFGILSCNTATAAQSIPNSYFMIKEMVERHKPELVVLDLFCLFYHDTYFSPTRFHQATDCFPLSLNKIDAIHSLVKEGHSEFYINYLLYHGRWKELEKRDYVIRGEFEESFQFVNGLQVFEEPFVPLDPSDTAEIPAVSLEYLKKIVDFCKEKDVELLLTVIPYRADEDNNNTSALFQQQVYNTAAKLAEEWDVDFINTLYCLDELDFDFTADMIESSHVNVKGSRKVGEFYGEYIRDHYDIPDRSEDKKYDEWHTFYERFLASEAEFLAEELVPRQ